MSASNYSLICTFCFLLFMLAQSNAGHDVDKIFGGSRAVKGQFPYMVALGNFRSKYAFCSGTLLTFTYVLTACHCMAHYDNATKQTWPRDAKKEGPFYAYADTISLKGFANSRTREIDGFIISSLCRGNSFPWMMDVGIAVVAWPFVYKAHRVEMVKLASLRRDRVRQLWEEVIRTEANCEIVGYGMVSSDVNNRYLRYATIKIKPESHCATEQGIRDDYFEKFIQFRGYACATSLNPDFPSHNEQGDSGGAVLYNDRFVGIVHARLWTDRKARNYPDEIFHRLDNFMGFIFKMTRPFANFDCDIMNSSNKSLNDLLLTDFPDSKSANGNRFPRFLFIHIFLLLFVTRF